MTSADITFDPAPTCTDKLRAKDLGLLEEDARRHGIPAIASAITALPPVVARPVVETPWLTDDDMYDLAVARRASGSGVMAAPSASAPAKPPSAAELRANYIDYCGGMDPETDRPGSLRYVRNIDAWYGRCPACGERVRLEHLMADDHFSTWFERLARRKDVSDHAAQRLLYAHVLPVLQDLLGVGDLDDLDDLDALDALFAEGRHRDDETNHGSRCTRARYWALEADDPIAPELRALLKRSRRYGICLVNPNLIELFDKRYKLENFLKWQYLWPDERLRLALGDDMYLDQLDLFAGLSAGPTLSDTDDELLMCLETNVYSIGNDDRPPTRPTRRSRTGTR